MMDLREITAALFQHRLERRIEYLEEENRSLNNRVELLEKQMKDLLDIQSFHLFKGEE